VARPGTFKPGQSGNPGGMPKLPESLRGIAILAPREIVRIIAKYARMTHSELQEAIKDTNVPAIEAAWAAQIIQAAYKGDGKALDRILLWAVGVPQPQPVEDGRLAELEGMTQAQLAEYIRARLPPAPAQSLQQPEPEIPPTTTQELSDE
jgi:hypothetical protein